MKLEFSRRRFYAIIGKVNYLTKQLQLFLFLNSFQAVSNVGLVLFSSSQGGFIRSQALVGDTCYLARQGLLYLDRI